MAIEGRGNLNIELIYGPAGVGKTEAVVTRIVDLLARIPSSAPTCIAVLAPTHSAVRNIRNRVESKIKNTSTIQFATIYSYFRIDWMNDDVIGPIHYYPYIFIDEFGLIKKELFQSILHKLETSSRNISLIISGDIVQLSPIYECDRAITFKKLKKHYERTPSFIVEHDYNSIFSLSRIRRAKHTLLSINHRSNEDVLSIINRLFYQCDCSFIKSLTTMRIIHLITNENYTFISSKYEHQQPLYDMIMRQKSKDKDTLIIRRPSNCAFKELLIFPGARFVANESYEKKGILNGDVLEVVNVRNEPILRKVHSEDELIVLEDEDVLPSFMLSAHKAQGLSIDKVIVCLDELFDPCLLYTACTRAQTKLEFYSRKLDDEKRKEITQYLNQFYELMQYYHYVQD